MMVRLVCAETACNICLIREKYVPVRWFYSNHRMLLPEPSREKVVITTPKGPFHHTKRPVSQFQNGRLNCQIITTHSSSTNCKYAQNSRISDQRKRDGKYRNLSRGKIKIFQTKEIPSTRNSVGRSIEGSTMGDPPTPSGSNRKS